MAPAALVRPMPPIRGLEIEMEMRPVMIPNARTIVARVMRQAITMNAMMAL